MRSARGALGVVSPRGPDANPPDWDWEWDIGRDAEEVLRPLEVDGPAASAEVDAPALKLPVGVTLPLAPLPLAPVSVA